MSTVIYNGYKVYATSLDEAIKLLKTNSEAVKEFLDEKSALRFIKMATLFHDINLLKNVVVPELVYEEKDFILENFGRNSLSEAFSKDFDNKEDSLFYEEDENYESVCFIYPEKLKSKKGGFYLFNAIEPRRGSSEEMEIAFKNIPQIEEYNYWNNTDRPENITKSQWDRRYHNWKIVSLSKTGYYAQDGLRLCLASSPIRLPHIKNDLDKYVSRFIEKNPLEKRLTTIINHHLVNAILIEEFEKLSKEEQVSRINSLTMNIMRQVHDNKISEEYLELKNKWLDEALSLIEEITPESLQINLSSLIEKSKLQLELNKKAIESSKKIKVKI